MIRVSRRVKLGLALFCFLFVPAIVRCLSPIRIEPSTTVGFAPLTVDVRVVVPRHEDNREACLVTVLQGVSSASCWTLNGAQEQVEWHRVLRRLGAGDYTLVGQLRRSSESFLTTPVHVSVVD